MQAWLDGMAPGYGSALMWTLFALIGLLILLVLIRIVRGFTFGTFVAGGRNRKARLAVMDATAVDSHRRLVLVRRDDVEHLILIGGPSDVVVEQNIRLVPASRRPAPEGPDVPEPPRRQEPVARPAPAQRPSPPPAPRTRQAPAEPPVVAPPPVNRAAPVQVAAAAAPAPVVREQPAPAVHTARPVSVEPPTTRPDLDDALLQELEVTLEQEGRPSQPSPNTDHSLDDEMSRLLGDLSAPRR